MNIKKIIQILTFLLTITLSQALTADGLLSDIKADEDYSIEEFLSILRNIEFKDNQEISGIRDRYADYYSRVNILQSKHYEKGYTIDYVDFTDQPALFNADTELIQDAVEANEKATEVINQLPLYSGSDDSQKPPGSVGVLRPRLRNFIENRLPAFKKLNGAPASSDGVDRPSYMHVVLPVANNGTYTLEKCSVNKEWATSFFNTRLDTYPYIENNTGCAHVINQLWILSKNQTYSLEAGWIQCNYFSTDIEMSFFVYSTTDDYQSMGGSDQYNAAGGFIQFSGSPIIPGATDNTIQLDTTYTISFNSLGNAGYALFINNSPVGYYLQSRFPSNTPFSYFQAGGELFSDTDNLLTLQGRYYGGGMDSSNLLPSSLANGAQYNSTLDNNYSPAGAVYGTGACDETGAYIRFNSAAVTYTP